MSKLRYKPKYQINDPVLYRLSATVKNSEIVLSDLRKFYVIGIEMYGRNEDAGFTYILSESLPGPYHSGSNIFRDVKEEHIAGKADDDES